MAAALLLAPPALAVDPFEIQVYDGTANAPGRPGLELHINNVTIGRQTAPNPELPPDQQSHLTLEPSFGVTPFWEIGGYLQTTLRSDGAFDYAGVKLRSKFVVPFAEGTRYRLGLNLELSMLPRAYDRSRFGTELRPIAAWENDHFIFAVNPIVNAALAAPDFDEGPNFEPALLAKVKIAGIVALGIEYYASFGPIAHVLPWQDQEHYLYEVVDVLSNPELELNIGVGEGLTSESNRWTAKIILGYTWEPEAAAPSQVAVRRASR